MQLTMAKLRLGAQAACPGVCPWLSHHLASVCRWDRYMYACLTIVLSRNGSGDLRPGRQEMENVRWFWPS